MITEETLEEVAKSEAFEFKVDYKPFETDLDYREYSEYGFEKGFIKGVKYQAERISLMEIELNHTKTLLESCEKALEDRDKKAEKMYSEEEMLQALNIGFTSTDETWEECVEFTKEQFKKK